MIFELPAIPRLNIQVSEILWSLAIDGSRDQGKNMLLDEAILGM